MTITIWIRTAPARAALLTLVWNCAATPAWAHVKWFSEFSFRDQPRTLTEVLTPTFWALALLSLGGGGGPGAAGRLARASALVREDQ